MKLIRMLTVFAVLFAFMTPAVAQVDTDGDGLLDLMDVPGFDSAGKGAYFQRKGIQDLDGARQLTNAIILDLQFNRVTSLESGDFQGLSNLRTLKLTFNRVTSLESGDFHGLSNLQRLHLYYNQITSLESGAFDGLSNLKDLQLYDNQITSLESGDFHGLSNLQTLQLYRNQITSLESGVFDGLSNLRTLKLWGNQIKSLDLSRGDFNSLTSLDVGQNSTLLLNDTELNQTGLNLFLSEVDPVDTSLVGTRFDGAKPTTLLKGRRRLDHLTVDEHLYDSYSQELNSFASIERNTLTIIGYGDANKDGFFNSNDLFQVFQAGEYEDGIAENSYWTTGDWNSDGDFGSADIVVAFQAGQYEAEAAVVAVPEPSAMALLLLGLIALSRSRARIR